MQTRENQGKVGKTVGKMDGEYHFICMLGPTQSTICLCGVSARTNPLPSVWWWGRNADVPISLTPYCSVLPELMPWRSIPWICAQKAVIAHYLSTISCPHNCDLSIAGVPCSYTEREEEGGCEPSLGKCWCWGCVCSFPAIPCTLASFCRLHRKSLRAASAA